MRATRHILERLKINKILQSTLDVISGHTDGDYAGFNIFRRLLHKAMTGDAKGNPAQILEEPDDFDSQEQERTVADLRNTQHSMPRTHFNIKEEIKTDPKRQSTPIIIVNYGGRDILIDGVNRINFWYSKGDLQKKLRVNYHWKKKPTL